MNDDFLKYAHVIDHAYYKDIIKNAVEDVKKDLLSNSIDFLDKKKVSDITGEDCKNIVIKLILNSLDKKIANLFSSDYKRVINLSGVIMHSNLGRACISKEVAEKISECSRHPIDLEIDLVTGKRIDRNLKFKKLANFIFKSPDSLPVNNNAAALLLICNTFAKGKKILVSRGELVEIGGSFRLHEILEASGAFVKEVGSTNRTRLEDYKNAYDSETAMILKVHPSNFFMSGYTCETSLTELKKFCLEKKILLGCDMGTAMLSKYLNKEIYLTQKVIKSGADILCFSADKLLCGPQAGIILSTSENIKRMHSNPLFRTLRCCKLTLTALCSTLINNLKGVDDYISEKINLSIDYIALSAANLKKLFKLNMPDHISVEIEKAYTKIGSGVAPDYSIDTLVLKLKSDIISVDKLAFLFRTAPVPVLGYIKNDCFFLDCRQINFSVEKVFNSEFFEYFNL
jgi:L-seryl-tRNA(Ser) seleniumtransferase